MDFDLSTALAYAGIGRGADGDMIGFYAQDIEKLLYSNTNGCAATPYANNIVGSIAAFVDLPRQLE